MKAFILLFCIVISGVIAISEADKDISGTWVMQQGHNGSNPPVFRITMNEGIWKGKADIPEQEIYDKPIHSIRVDGDSVFISVYKGGPVIKTRMVNPAALAGETGQEGRVDTVLFKKI